MLQMKNGETLQEHVSRIMAINIQMRVYRDSISDYTIVTKVIRSLSTQSDHVVAMIDESKDLQMPSIDELRGSL